MFDKGGKYTNTKKKVLTRKHEENKHLGDLDVDGGYN
jgi:hypothetical protein